MYPQKMLDFSICDIKKCQNFDLTVGKKKMVPNDFLG